MKYKIVDDLTSDVMFEAYGKDLREVFENAAEAMFSIICQLDKVKPSESREIEMEADSEGELMFDWLSELIARVDVEEMFFSKFEILELTRTKLRARIWGEPADPSKGETLVKAVTKYNYSFEKTPKGYSVRAVLDI